MKEWEGVCAVLGVNSVQHRMGRGGMPTRKRGGKNPART